MIVSSLLLNNSLAVLDWINGLGLQEISLHE